METLCRSLKLPRFGGVFDGFVDYGSVVATSTFSSRRPFPMVGDRDPVTDRLRGWFKLPREVIRITAGADQCNHLSTKFRRVRRAGFGHLGSLRRKCGGLHQIGSTSHEPSPRPETARRQRSCEASWQTQPPEHRNRSLPGSINVTENGSEIAGDACEVSTACSQSRTPPRGRVAVFSVGRRLIPARPRWAEPL